jgi:dolichyl-phosphate-mannose-protein mannosyltransferase
MSDKIRSTEPLILTCVFVVGLTLRIINLNGQAVEHFDEGVYSSVLWYDAVSGHSWPSRELYAPPLLSWCIEATSWLPGLSRYSPFLPGVLAGSAMILAVSWVARMWFGRVAGLFAAITVALNDSHVLFSGMALTDVPCLLFVVLSVGLATSALDRTSWRRMAAAGALCGIAWWFKYSGWLPIAIIWSGSPLWWMLGGRKHLPLSKLICLNLVLAVTAFVVWSPWLWSLQDVGGYTAILDNHRGYVTGFGNWNSQLATQLSILFTLDGLPAALAVGLGIATGGGHRWIVASCSTWNSDSALRATGYPPVTVLVRFCFAAVTATVITLVVWSPIMLLCFAIGGLAGMFLWPVLRRVWREKMSAPASELTEQTSEECETESNCAPTVDPLLGQCVCLTWIAGLLVSTPLYYPFPRLMLPLMSGIWLAASGGIAWWVEANLSVARRVAARTGTAKAAPIGTTGLLMVLLLSAAAVSISNSTDMAGTLVFNSRRSIVASAEQVGRLCRDSAGGGARNRVEQLPSGSIIRPDDAIRERPNPGPVESRRDDAESTAGKPIVIYAYGEPSLLFHLHQMRLVALPVSHLNLAVTEAQAARADSFLVIGPNAIRTPGFWEEWLHREHNFTRIGEVSFYPSAITLLNLFAPEWLGEHPESSQQLFEVYRIARRNSDL